MNKGFGKPNALCCEHCGCLESGILDSRKVKLRDGSHTVRRRRVCLECGASRFTFEIPDSLAEMLLKL